VVALCCLLRSIEIAENCQPSQGLVPLGKDSHFVLLLSLHVRCYCLCEHLVVLRAQSDFHCESQLGIVASSPYSLATSIYVTVKRQKIAFFPPSIPLRSLVSREKRLRAKHTFGTTGRGF